MQHQSEQRTESATIFRFKLGLLQLHTYIRIHFSILRWSCIILRNFAFLNVYDNNLFNFEQYISITSLSSINKSKILPILIELLWSLGPHCILKSVIRRKLVLDQVGLDRKIWYLYLLSIVPMIKLIWKHTVYTYMCFIFRWFVTVCSGRNIFQTFLLDKLSYIDLTTMVVTDLIFF